MATASSFRTPKATAYAVYVSRQSARRNKPQIPRDGRWRKKVADLAQRIGWQESSLWFQFDQLCLMAELEMEIPRKESEHAGWRFLKALYEKSNSAHEIN